MLRAERLRGIFQHWHAMALSQREDAVHLRAAAKKMHRDDRLHVRRFRERGVQRFHGKIESRRIDIDENRPRAEPCDAPGGGEKGVGRGDDRVARPDAERHQQHELRVRAGGNADRVFRAATLLHRALQPLDLRPQNERLRIGDRFDFSEDL